MHGTESGIQRKFQSMDINIFVTEMHLSSCMERHIYVQYEWRTLINLSKNETESMYVLFGTNVYENLWYFTYHYLTGPRAALQFLHQGISKHTENKRGI